MTCQSYFVATGQDSEDPMSYIARARLEFDKMLPAGGWRVATSFAMLEEFGLSLYRKSVV